LKNKRTVYVEGAKVKKKLLIFLSYSRKNTKKANSLKELLEEQGFTVLMDSEYIRAGKLWRSQIIDGIENCDVHVILLTKHSMTSDNVRRELDIARDKNKPILPISYKLKKTELSKEMEYQLIGLQQIRYEKFAASNNLKKLVLELLSPPKTRTMHAMDYSNIPRLVHDENNERIYLLKNEISVGRGPDVDIDLSPWDPNHYVSRKHAVISYDGGKWTVKREEKVQNPTQVNSVQVDCETGLELKEGVKVEFAGISFHYHQKD
jgi:hypothetical protein